MLPLRPCRSTGSVTTLPCTVMRVSFIAAPRRVPGAASRRLHPPSDATGPADSGRQPPVDTRTPGRGDVDSAPCARGASAGCGLEVLAGLSVTQEDLVDGDEDVLVGHGRDGLGQALADDGAPVPSTDARPPPGQDPEPDTDQHADAEHDERERQDADGGGLRARE